MGSVATVWSVTQDAAISSGTPEETAFGFAMRKNFASRISWCIFLVSPPMHSSTCCVHVNFNEFLPSRLSIFIPYFEEDARNFSACWLTVFLGVLNYFLK